MQRVDAWLTALRHGLGLMALGVTVCAGLFVWLYVGRLLVGRLGRLSVAARRLSAGDLSVSVTDDRPDEVGELARAMRLFRDAMADLADRNDEIDRQNRELIRLSRTDHLTGLANRRVLMDTMAALDAAGPASAVSLLMLDIDRFKAINDRYGHAAGDEALKHLAGTCLAHVRRDDLVARSGGEEFVILLPGLGRDAAMAMAERLRLAIADLPVPAGGEAGSFRLTVSFGVAQRAGAEPMAAVLGRADVALYEAKAAGRNRVRPAA
jgi:diguanylate cyclase (GGDEF)-like protein